jgi:hypothetical protein
MSAPAGGVGAGGAGSSGGIAATMGLSASQFAHVAATYGYVAFWIFASAGVILYNKWILTVWGFSYPITLTMWHMAFCSSVSALLVRACARARCWALGAAGRRALRRGAWAAQRACVCARAGGRARRGRRRRRCARLRRPPRALFRKAAS